MSRQLANQLKSYGRDEDTELVHMTKGEVGGLQALAKAHGGSLTINPDTGLAEAGFLKNILPVVAGIGLNALFPGSGALIGLGVGGFEAARTGDIGRGLMAGLGAYGGAGLGGAMGIGASAAPAATGITAAAPTATTAAATAAPTTASITTPLASSATAAPTAFATQPTVASLTASPTAASSFGSLTPSASTVGSISAPTGSTLGSVAPTTNAQLFKYGMAAGAPMLASAMEPKPVEGMMEDEDVGPNPGKYLSANFQGYDPRRPNPYYKPTGLGYAAQGGLMPNSLRYADGGQVPQLNNMPSGGLAALQVARDGYGASQTVDGNIPQMADGGSIGGYSDGGRMLKGPGDGMSDSIPGVIGNKQPARLADGEFVVPADVVSHLGNGSTDAGAKRLYSMMDKVRQARTGTKKQGKQIAAEKYLPVKKMADGGVTGQAPSSSSVVSPDTLAGLADLSALGSMIANTRGPAKTPTATTASNSAAEQVAATAAARPASEPVTFNMGKTGSFIGGYGNIRPDMLIDPEAAGWKLYSSNVRSNPFGMLLGNGDDSAGGVFGRLNRSLSPAPEGAYTDPSGNVWVRA